MKGYTFRIKEQVKTFMNKYPTWPLKPSVAIPEMMPKTALTEAALMEKSKLIREITHYGSATALKGEADAHARVWFYDELRLALRHVYREEVYRHLLEVQ
jgi:hypothetical protein